MDKSTGQIQTIDWTTYADMFPERYTQESILDWFIRSFLERNQEPMKVLDIGGGRGTEVLNQPHVKAWLQDPNMETLSSWMAGKVNGFYEAQHAAPFDLVVARGSLNYLSPEEIIKIPSLGTRFIANTFKEPPPTKWKRRLYTGMTSGMEEVRLISTYRVEHILRPLIGNPIRHEFWWHPIRHLVTWLPGVKIITTGSNSILLQLGKF